VKIWRMQDPRDPKYAVAAWRGAWSVSDGKLCPECTASTQHRIQPIVIEWEPGSELIGDFTCAGICDGFIVKKSVGDELSRSFRGFELGSVRMIQHSKLRRPVRVTKRTKPRIWLPYEGPELCELWIPLMVPIDRARSTCHVAMRCSTCGRERYTVEGCERTEGHWDKHRRRYLSDRYPREPGKGAFVQMQHLHGAGIFRIRELRGWVFCTDDVKYLVEERQYTNISFLECGDVV